MCLEHSPAYSKCSISHYLWEEYLFSVYHVLCTVQEQTMHSAKQSTFISLIEVWEEWWLILKKKKWEVFILPYRELSNDLICLKIYKDACIEGEEYT